MTRKTQNELESPAKVYQLDAVESKVDNVLNKLEEVLQQTKGVATTADVKLSMDEAVKESKEYTDGEVKKVHLTYGPMKANLTWFTRAVIGQGIVIALQFILAIIIWLSIGK